MFIRKLTSIAALAACICGTQAHASEPEAGYYARAYGGTSILNSSSIRVGNLADKADFSGGPIFGGSVGYDYNGPWRSEIEFTYRSSEINSVSPAIAAAGDYASTAIMLNGLYSFGEVGALRPYLGAGIGFAREVDFDLSGGAVAGGYSDSGLFAVQGIAGADFALSERISAFGEVRFFTVNDPKLQGPSGRNLTADYQSINFLVGASYRF